MFRAAQQWPWKSKKPVAFFRGSRYIDNIINNINVCGIVNMKELALYLTELAQNEIH